MRPPRGGRPLPPHPGRFFASVGRRLFRLGRCRYFSWERVGFCVWFCCFWWFVCCARCAFVFPCSSWGCCSLGSPFLSVRCLCFCSVAFCAVACPVLSVRWSLGVPAVVYFPFPLSWPSFGSLWSFCARPVGFLLFFCVSCPCRFRLGAVVGGCFSCGCALPVSRARWSVRFCCCRGSLLLRSCVVVAVWGSSPFRPCLWLLRRACRSVVLRLRPVFRRCVGFVVLPVAACLLRPLRSLRLCLLFRPWGARLGGLLRPFLGRCCSCPLRPLSPPSVLGLAPWGLLLPRSRVGVSVPPVSVRCAWPVGLGCFVVSRVPFACRSSAWPCPRWGGWGRCRPPVPVFPLPCGLSAPVSGLVALCRPVRGGLVLLRFVSPCRRWLRGFGGCLLRWVGLPVPVGGCVPLPFVPCLPVWLPVSCCRCRAVGSSAVGGFPPPFFFTWPNRKNREIMSVALVVAIAPPIAPPRPPTLKG